MTPKVQLRFSDQDALTARGYVFNNLIWENMIVRKA